MRRRAAKGDVSVGRRLVPAGRAEDIDIQFMNAGGVLFGVKDYVPALMEYVEKYGATLNFFHNLIAVDGPGRRRLQGRKPDIEPTKSRSSST
jgi:sulfide:quinone oxidoreductase